MPPPALSRILNQLGVVPRYEANQRSLLRALVPFTVDVCGPSTEVVRQAFIRRPALIRKFFFELERCDTAPVPRVALAEAMQALLEGSHRGSDIRAHFARAETLGRRDTLGEFEPARFRDDPTYRLRSYIVSMAAAFYTRLFAISTTPLLEARHAVFMRYTADITSDNLLRDAVFLLKDPAARAYFPEEYNDLFATLMLLERDVMGDGRLDKRGGRARIFHTIDPEDVGRNDVTRQLLDVAVVQRYANFVVKEETKFGSRWKDVIVSCGVEDHRLDTRVDQRDPTEALEAAVAAAAAAAAAAKPRRSATSDAANAVDPSLLASLPASSGVPEDGPWMLPNSERLVLECCNNVPVEIVYNEAICSRPNDRWRQNSVSFELAIVRQPTSFFERWFARGTF